MAIDEQASYDRARGRVRKIRGFYIHSTVYVLVNLLLIAINLLTSPSVLWFVWPLLGWGIGLAAHGLAVFGLGGGGGGLWGREWEERTIKKLQERDRAG
jgi:hypothetical protein